MVPLSFFLFGRAKIMGRGAVKRTSIMSFVVVRIHSNQMKHNTPSVQVVYKLCKAVVTQSHGDISPSGSSHAFPFRQETSKWFTRGA